MADLIVVIPTNRGVNLENLEPLIEVGARFIVVDDTPGSIVVDHPSFRVFDWEDRRRMLGPLDVGFPRSNGACRDFGFYVAWRESGDEDIVIALDDDCEIQTPDFPAQVESVLGSALRPTLLGRGRHANILELYENVPYGVFPRGFPYSARLDHEPWNLGEPVASEAVFNVGLWQGVFDVNAIDKIAGPEWVHPAARLKERSVSIPPGVFVSVCSGNMQFRRRVLPAVYQLPMHVPLMPGWMLDRYGDIWAGFMLKLLVDIRGDTMVVGGPTVLHARDGERDRNVWLEHIGHLVNEELLEAMISASEEVAAADYLTMFEAFHEELRKREASCSPMLARFLGHLSEATRAWVAALRRP